MILAIAVVIVGLIVLQFCLILIRVNFFWKSYPPKKKGELPSVSVLIAARNEELLLPELLKSLQRISYPSEKIEFLIANDQSTDETESLINTWCIHHSNRYAQNITKNESGKYHKNGKANALAILAEEATGEFLFFTDADCEISTGWIQSGIAAFDSDIGLVVGITQVHSRDFFGKYQELDWWNTLGLVKVAADLGIQTTGLGNNMAIRKSVYLNCGGFKNLPYSLTEDLEIAKSITKVGFKTTHQVRPSMRAQTKQEDSLVDLLSQRKRWFSGVMTLPFSWLVLLGIQFFYLPAILFILSHYLHIGLGLLLLKNVLQTSFIKKFANRAGVKINWSYLIGFDLYFFCINALTILYYFWPSKIRWKSRTYL
jgi:cellulose synthase/poly-beta-1,6-N-acetylglucosamine synthase-like glycosyltransferase